MSVAGVVVDAEGRALVIQRRDNGHWEPPGGVLELDEGVPDGLRREVLEETGLEVEPECLTGVYKNMARGIVALVFRCRSTGGLLTESDEVKDFQWVSAESLDGLMTEAFAVRVLDSLRYDGVPAVREHDGQHVLSVT